MYGLFPYVSVNNGNIQGVGYEAAWKSSDYPTASLDLWQWVLPLCLMVYRSLEMKQNASE